MLGSIKRATFNVAIYIRLSKEDEDRGYDESESITNQKSLLVDYVEKLGWEYNLVDIYIDPGYTGTNFNRPDFQRMIKDIKLGNVNMVITKDLSRLGRDYIETGEYIEKWFPENEVRYVSVTDGIDTFSNNNANNDIAPFKSVLNDMYSKDLSKKIRTALTTMRKQGKWISAQTPLGYERDPNDKNHLIICEQEAQIVRTIFDMALSGEQIGVIRKYLSDNNIPTASQSRYNRPTIWSNRTIKRVLQNKMYTGLTIQGRTSRISYKNRKLKLNPIEQWHIIEHTHEPIISEEEFNRVQKMVIAQSYSRNEKKNTCLLDGLLFCYECKHRLGIRIDRRKKMGKQLFTTCNYYRRTSKYHLCTSHGFPYYRIEDIVLNYIKQLFLNIDNKKVESNIKNSRNSYDYKKMLKKIEQEIEVINNNIDKMYVDKLNNKVSESMYERLFNKLCLDIKEKEKEYQELKELEEDSKSENNKDIDKVIKEFLSLDTPTPELMRIIINKIEIHQDKQIDIIFNFKKLNYFLPNGSLV